MNFSGATAFPHQIDLTSNKGEDVEKEISLRDELDALFKRAVFLPCLDWVGMVQEFHRTFNPTILAPTPEFYFEREKYYDTKFIREEFEELLEAQLHGDLPAFADALADLVYVTIRAALIHGIDLRPIFQAVHQKNMTKTAGLIRSDGKVMKPEGWEELDLMPLLRAQNPLDTSPIELPWSKDM